MSKFSNVEEEFIALSEKKIDLSAILMKYFSYWRWFIASVLLCLFIAIIYLYFAIPKYEVTTAILFKDDQKGGSSDIRIFEEMGVMTRRNNADNEVEILKKSLIAESVIKEQNMNVTYFQMEPLISILNKVIPGLPKRKTAILYGDELPVEVKIPEDKLAALGGNITFDLLVYPEGALIFNGEHDGNEYQISASSNDTIVKLPFCELMLTKGKAKPNANMWLRIQIQNPLSVADAFVNSMVIELTSKTSSVADVALTTSNTELGKDFLRAYFVAYNEYGIRDQLDLAERTSKIIDNHLSMLNNDLNMVEDQAQEFKQSQGLTNIGSQADLYNTQLASVREKKMD
ncbi:MAG: Wzz/FepE/Etk N-terminal domain-containing protein, partial [Proteiniphilum sp.]